MCDAGRSPQRKLRLRILVIQHRLSNSSGNNRLSFANSNDQHRNDLLVYLALSQFDRRPKFRDLSPDLQHDVKGLFGSYQQACAAADLMLMSLGNLAMLAQRAQLSPIGPKRKNALWIHINALPDLDPLLRLYEGCASRTLGGPEEANVIQLSLHRPASPTTTIQTLTAAPTPPYKLKLCKAQIRARQKSQTDAETAPNSIR